MTPKPKNLKKLKKAAKLGDATAQFELAEHLWFKTDSKSNQIAAGLYRAAAEQGHLEAQYTLANLFHVYPREYIGEEETKVGDESRSYLGEHIFKQVFSIYATEDDNRAHSRKRNRTTLDKTREEVLRALIQMGGNSDGGTGSNSVSKPKSVPRRTKNGNGSNKSKTSARIRRAG